jgi:hypothetical protein
MKRKITIVSILIVFFLAFYVQNQYAIFSIDDWTYAFIVNEDVFNYQSVAEDHVIRQPITSLHDAIVSQSRDYFKTNGRFIIHSIVQYICGTMTMPQFIILNTIMFGFFTILIIKLSDGISNLYNLLFVLSSIWILFPHKGLTFMGNVTCSVDYLWSSVGTLLFISLFLWLKNIIYCRYSSIITLFLTIYSFIAGSLQESFTIGVSGTLFLYIIYKRKKIDKKEILISISYIIGTITCMITPANFRRFDDIGGGGFHFNCLLGLLSSPIVIITLIILAVLLKNRRLISTIKENYLIIIPFIINICFAVFIAYNGRHQLTSINVFGLIFIIRMWKKYASYNIKIKTSVLLTIIALFSYYPILQARKNYYESYQTILYRINKENHDGIVSGKEFEYNTEIIKSNRILECNYIATFTFQDWDFFEKSLSIYLTKGKNNNLVKEVTR